MISTSRLSQDLQDYNKIVADVPHLWSDSEPEVDTVGIYVEKHSNLWIGSHWKEIPAQRHRDPNKTEYRWKTRTLNLECSAVVHQNCTPPKLSLLFIRSCHLPSCVAFHGLTPELGMIEAMLGTPDSVNLSLWCNSLDFRNPPQ